MSDWTWEYVPDTASVVGGLIVAGKTWGVALVETPFTSGQFEIPAQSASQALQLQRTLDPSA